MRYAERPHKTYRLALDAQRASQRTSNVVMVIIGVLALLVIVIGQMGGFAW